MEKKKSNLITEKLKHIKKDQLMIILLAGVLLVVIAIPVNKEETKEETAQEAPYKETASDDSYELQLEKRLKTILSGVENIGEVEVMITLKSKGEKIVEKDESSTTQVTEETDSAGGTRTTEDVTKNESTVFTEENGASVPYVVKEEEPSVEGVLVIAKGGDDATVVTDIMSAIKALFGIEAHKIKVLKMN